MSICRLCLNDVEGAGVSNPLDIIKTLRKFLPHMSRTLRNIPVICETCAENVNTAEGLLGTKTENETKIRKEMRRLKVAKINLRGFHPNTSNNVSVCRICLKVIKRPRIFLYDNSRNVLQHDYILKMLSFCNIELNLNFTDWPVICDECWENLQISYTFKKDYLEVERKIRVFCQDFDLPMRNICPDILKSVRNYFLDGYCEIINYIKKEKQSYIGVFGNLKKEGSSCASSSTPVRKVKTESNWFVKTEDGGECSGMSVSRKRFTDTENLKLVQAYYEVTKNGQYFPAGYWNKIAEKWKELVPLKPLSADRLGCQIEKIFQGCLVSRAQLDIIKKDIEKKQNTTIPQKRKKRRSSKKGSSNTKSKNDKQKSLCTVTQAHNEMRSQPSAPQNSDSDDSFVEEVVHSSFTPFVKLEPLNESDVEFNSIETKIEVESDCESLPQLERMDLPAMDFKIEDVCSLEVKREAFDEFMNQDEEINVDGEDGNKSRRNGRQRKSEKFRCMDCNFETRFWGCFERHKILHLKGKKKVNECPRCPYRITNKWLFKKHLRNHKQEDDEIPILEPVLIPIY